MIYLHLFRHPVPPSRVQWGICWPADILAVLLPRGVFVDKCRSVLYLGVEVVEGRYVGIPRVGVHYFKGLSINLVHPKPTVQVRPG